MTKKEITYIKNNQEKNRKVHNYNVKRIANQIFSKQSPETFRKFYYTVDDNVHYLEFKNVRFYEDVFFKCPKDTILIFDNCTFDGQKIYIERGNIEFINPKFKYGDFYIKKIEVKDGEDFSFSTDENINILLDISSKKIHINSNNNTINSININNKDLIPEEVILQNISTLNNTTTINSKKILINSSAINAKENINLISNNIIIDDTSTITSKCININNIKFKKNEDITLNKNIWYSEKYARLRVISSLKELRKKLNKKIDKELEPTIQNNKKIIEKLKKEHELEIQKNEKLNNNLVKNLKRNYKEKKISDYQTKGEY